MNFLQTLVIALIPTVGVGLTVLASTREFALKRRIESTDRFYRMIQLAHARDPEREAVGVAEQIAAIHLVADFGKREKVLRNAARAALEEIGRYTFSSQEAHVQRVNAAIVAGLSRL